MLRLANRPARAATAGLLGLLVAAPPLARAEDDEGKRSRDHVARQHADDRDGKDDEGGKRRGDRNERRREDSGRNHRRREQVQQTIPRQVERDRHEAHGRPDRRGPPPAQVVRRDHDDHRDRQEARDHQERRDRSEWRDDHREWRQDQEWREHQEWRQARYVVQHDQRWHWHGDRWCPPGHRHPPGRRVGWYRPHDDWRWARYRRPVIVHSGYYCAPCSHWYDGRYAFERHVYGYHSLPQLAFGDAVAQMVWGLVYFGP